MKAFLSHSSKDKEFIRSIAKSLGRQFCLFDEYAFNTGIEFKESIEKGLEESSIFVLFASKNTRDSIWVNFEIDEAWYKKLHNKLQQSLVFIIDSSVTYQDVPLWLQKAKISKSQSAKQTAREIRTHLDELQRAKQYPYFIGRSRDKEILENALTPFDGTPPPHVIFLAGLPGIGRRALIKECVPKLLNLHRQVEITIDDGDSINDLCIKIADKVEPYNTIKGFHEIIKQIQNLGNNNALERILKNLRLLATSGELPIFIDHGGLLDQDGFINSHIMQIINKISQDDDAYIFFVTTQRPKTENPSYFPIIHLAQLVSDDTKKLLSLHSNRLGVKITPSQISELSEYISGYPPSVYFAVQQAKNYGIDLLMGDKLKLVQFRTAFFLKHLKKFQIDDKQSTVLKILAIYSPLPIIVISESLNYSLEDMYDILYKFIDLSLIVLTEEGNYAIAAPIISAVHNVFNYPSNEEHSNVTKSLMSYLDKNNDEKRLELSRVLYRAATFSNNIHAKSMSVHLASDLIRLTESFYHDRRYKESIKCGYESLELRPENTTARSYLIRSLIQEEQWESAYNQLEILKKYDRLREIYFLKGFLERKKGNLIEATKFFEESEHQGKKGAALDRELANCYLLIGKFDEAKKYIEEAVKKHGDNPFLIDLLAQIAIKVGDQDLANEALDRLEFIDNPSRYYHRRSTAELSFGLYEKARASALNAINIEKRPSFEFIVQLAQCEIKLGNINEAEEAINKLDSEFRHIRHDIRIGLRCRIELMKARYSEVLNLCERLRDKEGFHYKDIKLNALRGELQSPSLSDELRSKYYLESEKINNELNHHSYSHNYWY